MSIPVGSPHAALACRSISNTKFMDASTKSGFRRRPCTVISGFIFAQLSVMPSCAPEEAGPPAAGHDLSRSPAAAKASITIR